MFQIKEQEERCHTKDDYAQFNKEIETLIMRRPTKITGTEIQRIATSWSPPHMRPKDETVYELKQEQHDSLLGEDRAKVALRELSVRTVEVLV